MASTDAIPVPRKNTAYRFYFAIRKPSDSTLITTWAGADSEVSLDGAAYSDCTNEATEIGTTGTGYIDLTSSEMNADCVLLKVTVTNTGSVPLVFALYPESAGDYRVADTQKVDVDTIKTNPVVNGGTITFPTGATLASTTNITAATGVVLSGVTHTGAVIPTVTTLTGHTPQTGDTYALANGAAGFVAIDTVVDAILDDTGTSGVLLSTTALGAIWNRLTSSMTTAGSIGKKLADWVVGTIDTYTGNTPQTGDSYARLGAPAGASVAADIAAVKSETVTIVADTNELQTDWTNGGRLDLILDARSSQTSVDDIPTNAELATALATGVNVTQVDGSNLGTHGIGQFPADVRDWGGLGATIAIDIDNSAPSVAVSHVHDDVISAAAVSAAAVTKIQTGLASQTSVNTIGTDITTLLGRVTSNVYTMWTNLIAMISGSGGTAAFTTTAMANAPAGGGGGGSGDASQDTLLEVQDTVDALAISLAGTVITVVNRVTGGTINAVMGDDYKVRSGSELSIVVDDPAGALHTRLAAIGVGNLAFGASRVGEAAGEITGTIASLSYLSDVLTIVVEITACGASLRPDNYTYQIQSSQTQGAEVDDVVEVTGRLVLSRRTVAAVS